MKSQLHTPLSTKNLSDDLGAAGNAMAGVKRDAADNNPLVSAKALSPGKQDGTGAIISPQPQNPVDDLLQNFLTGCRYVLLCLSPQFHVIYGNKQCCL